MKNVVVALYDVESEGFQSITELKNNPVVEKSSISQAVLVKKQDGKYSVLDSFDSGVEANDDVAIGGLVGMCLGVLGGPIGMLLGASYGSLIGLTIDSMDSGDSASILEQIAGKLDDGVAFIGLVDEEDESILDTRLSSYKVTIMRYDAGVIAKEVETAKELEKDMNRQAKAAMRKQKQDEIKEKVDAKRGEIKGKIEAATEGN